MEFLRIQQLAMSCRLGFHFLIPRQQWLTVSLWPANGSTIQQHPRRLIATSALRAAPKASSPTKAPGQKLSWPPIRSTSPEQANNSSLAAGTGKSNTLTDLYGSDDPAQWAVWSSDDFYKRHTETGPRAPVIKSRPSTGRTVYISGNVDPARAFQLVNIMCRRNSVAKDHRQQRFHERAGLKRKRLRSERWRRRFKDSFRATLVRVRDLAKQGW